MDLEEPDDTLSKDEVQIRTPTLMGYSTRECVLRMVVARIKERKATQCVSMSPQHLDWLLSELDATAHQRPFRVLIKNEEWSIKLGLAGRMIECCADESITDDMCRWSNG